MSIRDAKRIVIKVGSSLIVDDKGNGLRFKWLKSLIEDVVALRKRGKEVIIVTSGSVALGKKHIASKAVLKLEEKQAAAACGQSELMRHYQKFLNDKKIQGAQILLTIHDFKNRRHYLNAKNTLETLLANNVVPIINENDTVATTELRFGDNDRLAARVAQMTCSDLLILFSDVDGLYTSNPRLDPNATHIDKVEEITERIEAMGGEALHTGVGSGGMITKISAAKMAMASGCSVILTKGVKNHPLKELESGGKHTIFVSKQTPMNARKQWIAGSINITGAVIVDSGAVQALKNGKSLLPAGIIDVSGTFNRGDTIEIRNHKSERIGVGITAYSSSNTMMIKGHKSQDIENIVGFSGRSELINRDDMVMDE